MRPATSLDQFDPEYLVLNDVLAFDLRVFDPGARSTKSAGTVVEPGDPGWQARR